MDTASKSNKGFVDDDEDDESDLGKRDEPAQKDRKSGAGSGSDQKATTLRSNHSATEQRRLIKINDSKFGTLDIIVNNAGISGQVRDDIRGYKLEEFKKVFDVNVNGVFLGMKHAACVMIPRGKGSIVSLASVSSIIGSLGPHGYTASKHAVVGLTKSVAAELGKHGIRVNCVSPYGVPTSLALPHQPEGGKKDAVPGFQAFVGSHANLKGVVLTENDVAEAVLFLASDESRYVSGLNLTVDGGFTSVNHALEVFR